MDHVRAFWRSAAEYPADKELVYPEHSVAQEFDQQAGKTVFEYGCGGGSDAMSYLRRGCTVVYADVVPGNVEAATVRIEAVRLAARAKPMVLKESVPIPVEEGQFDVVSSHGVIHHIEDPEPVIAEFFRVLKPGGLVYVMLYTEHLWAAHWPRMTQLLALSFTGPAPTREEMGRLERTAFAWCTDGRGCPYARAYTEAEGRELLERAGFIVNRAFQFNSAFFRTFKAVKPPIRI